MRSIQKALMPCLVVALLGRQPTAAEQVALGPNKDNAIYSDADNLSNGAGEYFFAGKNSNGGIRRGLLAFDLAGSIPPGSTIQSVTLQLHMSRTQAGTQTIRLHGVLANWGEGGSDADGQEGGGAVASNNDATWRYTFYNPANPGSSPAWTNLGGDYASSGSASLSVGGNGTYTWPSTPALIADVQAWLDNPATNFGWIVIGAEGANQTAKRFGSRTNTNASRRPVLTVVFTPPATAGACCFVDGTCQTMTLSTCAAQGGSYQGDGSSCTPNPCPQPTGACCFGDETCQVLTQSACSSQGGSYQGDTTSCTPNPCQQPTGACCFDNGTCSEITEQDCIAGGGSYQGDGVACSADLCPVILTPFVDSLPIPAVAQPVLGNPGGTATYEIAMRQLQQQLHRDLPPTTVWGYGDGPSGGNYPGPTIVAGRDLPVTVKWINDLRDAQGNLRTDHYLDVDLCPHGAVDQPKTVVHLHGGHVPSAVDGYPEATFLPGSFVVFEYPNNQLPALIWYHDHALGITRLNVQMGLAGGYLIRDDFEDALNLPGGEFHVPLIIQDRMFNSDGSFRYLDMWHEHFFGDKMLVNGKVWPYLNVKQGQYRFRLLNGCNSRTLTLALSNGQSFQQIGTDGGMLPAPVTLSSLTFGPGERADIVVNFAAHAAGTEIVLMNSAPAPYPGTPGVGVIPEVMKFIVQGQPGDTDPVPALLRPLEVLNEADAVMSRDFTLRKMTEPCAGSMWMINDLGFDTITEFPVLDTIEVWRFINRSGVSHPMHMHLVMFQILDRQNFEVIDDQVVSVGAPVPPAAHEAGWKDTVMCHPQQITRVIARFDDYTGRYPYHCHILEHEDHEMMRQFQVVEAAQACCSGSSCSTAMAADCLALGGVPQGAGTICRLYGDVFPMPFGNGIIDVDDILRVLDAFLYPEAYPEGDIAPCGGNALIDVDDILAMLGAFIGYDECPDDPCP